ncbi:hypothetical protein SDC9_167869 [bioreactor metagenome]|uniref:Uncharacterized protein n=1 Tax=bioreactor metagenome TaxID=1076179 RepID=A0A645G3J8_9ZZZZ
MDESAASSVLSGILARPESNRIRALYLCIQWLQRPVHRTFDRFDTFIRTEKPSAPLYPPSDLLLRRQLYPDHCQYHYNVWRIGPDAGGHAAGLRSHNRTAWHCDILFPHARHQTNSHAAHAQLDIRLLHGHERSGPCREL